MAELSMIDGWVRFRPLYCGRYLGDLIMRCVSHNIYSRRALSQEREV